MRFSALLAPVFVLFTGPALALGCSEGSHFADGIVTPSVKEMPDLVRATQYAWNGSRDVIETCNLTTEDGDYEAVWQLFSGEVDQTHGGICIMLTGSSGQVWYSCASPADVSRALTAPLGTPASELRFTRWRPDVASFAQ